MSGLFTNKGRRNYRSKADNSDEEFLYEPESLYEQGSKGVICGAAVTASTGSGTIKKTRSVLSFEDDLDPDDGAIFKVKKTNLSRRVSKQTKDQHKKKKPVDSDIPKVVNKKESVKPVTPREDPVESEKKLENLRRQLLDLTEEEGPVTSSTQPEASSASSLLKRGAIPDAATIHQARKQREQAKFLLEQSDQHESVPASSGKSDGKRLVREDDDDEEDDFDDMGPSYTSTSHDRRPAFIVSSARDTVVKRPAISTRLNRRAAELDSLRRDFLAAEHASDRDSEEDTEWEKQQIQKALITQNTAVMEAIQPIDHRDDLNSNTKTDPLFAGLSASNLTVTNLKSILEERFRTLSTSLSNHQTDLQAAQTDLDRGQGVIADCREKLPHMARKFGFAQEMKDYIDDLVECFNEKMSKIEYMERRTIILYRERYNKLIERRRLDMKDLADLATQPTSTSAQSTGKSMEETKLIEARRRRCAEREARRIRRQRARELSSVQQPIPSHVDGTSTDDEEPQAVVAKRKADIDALLVDAAALFEDVVEEYCELSQILNRFARWHTEFPESYSEAYVALCLPQLFAPIIRLQLIGWNPIAPTCNPLEEMPWFNDLLDFGCLPLDSEALTSDGKEGKSLTTLDDDLKVLPIAIEKLVLERLNELIDAAWDPLSRHESERLVNVVRHLTVEYPSVRVGSRPTEQLFTTIVKRIEVTIQEDIFIPLYSNQLMQSRQGPAFQFFERQLRIGMKMLKNVLLWHDLLSTEALQHVSLTCLVNRYLLVGLASLTSAATFSSTTSEERSIGSLSLLNNVNPFQTTTLLFQDAVDYLSEIVEAIPVGWIGKSHSTKSVDPQPVAGNDKASCDALSQLRRFISQLIDHPVFTVGVNRQGCSHLEREWLNTLNQLKSSLG